LFNIGLIVMNHIMPPNAAQQIISHLNGAPEQPYNTKVGGHACTVDICIPYAFDKISEHFKDLLPKGLSALVSSEGIAQPYRHLGVHLRFREPTLIEIYDRDLVLAEELKNLITAYGTVILENVYMPDVCRNEGQRNIFPDLDFHFDRSPSQPNRYSLFCRDPHDPIQRAKRDSSTLIIPNIVAYLQQLREGFPPDQCKRAMYRIFKQTDIDPLVNEIMLEQAWRAPEGVGEICLIDNRTVFHASYYRFGKGYPIGVRYLF